MERIFTPVVNSGHGKGKRFIEELIESDLPPIFFEGKIFPGTLALRLNRPINLDPSLAVRFESVEYFQARFEGEEVLIKWTIRYPAIVQVISKYNLRHRFNLVDGSRVLLAVDSKYFIPNSIISVRNYLIEKLSRSVIGNTYRKAKYYLGLTPKK